MVNFFDFYILIVFCEDGGFQMAWLRMTAVSDIATLELWLDCKNGNIGVGWAKVVSDFYKITWVCASWKWSFVGEKFNSI